jgi:hypothetical protein
LFAVAAAPAIAGVCAQWWRDAAAAARARAPARLFWDISQDLGRARPATVWMAVASAVTLGVSPSLAREFPEPRFPVAAVDRNAAWLAPAGRMPKILTSDQWADYLIYRLYPRQRVFFDGRSDFYGPALGAEYRELLVAGAGWRGVLERYGFERALLPRDWPLASMLDREPGWRRVYEDAAGVLFAREAIP